MVWHKGEIERIGRHLDANSNPRDTMDDDVYEKWLYICYIYSSMLYYFKDNVGYFKKKVVLLIY